MVVSEIERDSSWSFANVTRAQTQYLTHGYHRYPAKFIPQLVSRLIDEYSNPGERICDSFGGCGTTLVEARLAGRPSFGFDVNPVAVLITRAKTTPICPDKLSQAFTNLCAELEGELPLPSEKALKPLNVDRLLYWFGEVNLPKVLSLRTCLEQERDLPIRRFFLCALSQVLKNCSYWLATSTKPQKDPNKLPEPPIEAFIAHASRMIDRNQAFFEELKRRHHLQVPAIMRKADARNIPLADESIDLIITSPPYSTSYDYSDIHQLSALLFGFCRSLADFRHDFIGRKGGNEHYMGRALKNSRANEVVQRLSVSDVRLSQAITAYFFDMDLAYKEIRRVLRQNKRACIVIGDTELRRVPIPNTEIAIEQLKRAGLQLERVIERPVVGRVLAPFRSMSDGRFTSSSDPDARKVYSHEYIIIVRKV